MQIPFVLLSSVALISTNVVAQSTLLNFVTWNCSNCVDNSTCSQVNYQVTNTTCQPLTRQALGVKVFFAQPASCKVRLYDIPGCSGDSLEYQNDQGAVCHNEAGLGTKRFFQVTC